MESLLGVIIFVFLLICVKSIVYVSLASLRYGQDESVDFGNWCMKIKSMTMCLIISVFLCGCGELEKVKDNFNQSVESVGGSDGVANNMQEGVRTVTDFMGLTEREEILIDEDGTPIYANVEKQSPDVYQIGDTVSFKLGNCYVDITMTEWGKVFSSLSDNVVVYVDYIVENIGKQTVTFTDSYFELYGDGYKVSDTSGDESIMLENISSGRKLRAKAYFDMNPDNYAVIELQCADAVFLLKGDEGTTVKENNITYDEDDNLYDNEEQGGASEGESDNILYPTNGDIDYLIAYSSIIEDVAASYDEYCEYTLYDLDGDGIKELITSQGTCEADWSNTVYTLEDGYVSMIGEFFGSVMLYAAEDGNGLYAVSGKMEYQNIDQITKNGNQLYVETIMSGEIGVEDDYYSNDNPVSFTVVTDDSLLRQ